MGGPVNPTLRGSRSGIRLGCKVELISTPTSAISPVNFADQLGLLPQDPGPRLFANVSQNNAGNTATDASDEMQQVGRWELKFGAPRVQGDLPALYHAVPKF